MIDVSKGGFPQSSTCGFREDVGIWDMDFDTPKTLSPASLNNFSLKIIQGFLTSFRFLCEPVEVKFDAIYFDEENQIKEIRENQRIEISSDNTAIPLCDLLTLAIGAFDQAYFINISIDCNVHIFIPDQDGKMSEDLVAKASRFYFGYVMEPSESCSAMLVPVASSASFQVSIDVWVEKTQNSDSLQPRNNYITASKNHPLLTAALREWENISGNQISEWSSRPYKNQIVRYGFNLGSKDS